MRKNSKNDFEIIKISLHDEIGLINLRDKLIKISYKAYIKNPMSKFTEKYFSSSLCKENKSSIQKSLLGSLKKIKKKRNKNDKKDFFYTIKNSKKNVCNNETIEFFKLKKKKINFENEEKLREYKNEKIYLSTDFKKINKPNFDDKNFTIKKPGFYFSEFY
jgi:hypothetical protein